MPFSRVLGQSTAVDTLTRSLRSGRRHHAYRFEGPDGVGKELTAFAVAQALVCETSEALGCGQCASCRRAVTLSGEEPFVPQHPDVVLVGKGLYPASIIGKTESTGIGVEQVRRIVLARAGYPPHEGRHLVFIVRDADDLTQSAANALLKTLEEPGEAVQFLLLTSRPRRLLDTIVSRTLPVRFGPLPEDVLQALLSERGLDPSAAMHAQGSASRAIELAQEDVRQAREDFFASMRDAISSPGPTETLDLAASVPKDRREVSQLLTALAQQLATSARKHATGAPGGSRRALPRHALVVEALDALERNANPQLVVESLVLRLRNA